MVSNIISESFYLFKQNTEHLQREALERVAREMGIKQVCTNIVNSLSDRKLVGRVVLNSTA